MRLSRLLFLGFLVAAPVRAGSISSSMELGLRTTATEKSSMAAFGASLLVPGAGQVYAGYGKTAYAFFAIEAAAAGTWLYLKSEGDSRQTEFERFAQDNAGAYAGPSDGDHDRDKYYEALIKYGPGDGDVVWSGNYYGDAYLGEFAWAPNFDEDAIANRGYFLIHYEDFATAVIDQILGESNSYNLEIWKEAWGVNKSPDWESSNEDRGGDWDLGGLFQTENFGASNIAIEDAFNEYRSRAYDGRWAWNWASPEDALLYRDGSLDKMPKPTSLDDAQARRAAYVALRDRSNEIYKQATFVGGLLVFNHVVSSIHAGKAAAVRNRRNREAPAIDLGLGIDPNVQNPGVEIRLSRAF